MPVPNPPPSLPFGLLNAFLLDGKGGTKPLDPNSIDEWQPEDGPLWLNFSLNSEETSEWITNHANLDPLAAEALLTVESRPRVTRIGKGALLAFAE